MSTETTTTPAKTADSNCECAQYEIGNDVQVPEGAEPDVTIETTGCTATTRRTFAPGHDAKLKSMLIRAGVRGMDVRYGRASGVVHTTDWQSVAALYGFGDMVAKGVQRGRDKAIAKLDKAQARRAAKPPRTVAVRVISDAPVASLDELVADVVAGDVATDAPVEAPQQEDDWFEAKIKIGRWIYDATIDTATQVARYSDRNGDLHSVEPAKYVRV